MLALFRTKAAQGVRIRILLGDPALTQKVREAVRTVIVHALIAVGSAPTDNAKSSASTSSCPAKTAPAG